MSEVICPFTSMLRASPETSPSSLRFWYLRFLGNLVDKAT